MLRLLLCLHLPRLPLEALRPSWSDRGQYSVVDAERIVACSDDAADAGVTLGMRAGGVAAVAPDTVLLPRDRDREASTLDALATAMMQFSPEVALFEDATVVLEVGPSLRLFGGPAALCRRVRASCRALGLTVQLGAAPTVVGAWLLARRSPRRRGPVRRVLTLRRLAQLLDLLPCSLLPTAVRHHEWLDGIGARDLGGLRRLPRAGLKRRTHTALVDELDRAYGDAPVNLRWIVPPARFSAQVETFERVEHADELLHGATGLILQLVGWLQAVQLAVSSVTLSLLHERGRAAVAPSEIVVSLAEPVWREDHLLRLLRERLAKSELSAPVIGLRLTADKLERQSPLSDCLFPEPGGSTADFQRLLELLTARLGANNVMISSFEATHIPETANRWIPASKPMRAEEPDPTLTRPFWLLPKAIPLLVRQERPFYGSPLKILSRAERIEAAWWGEDGAARDYYVAQGDDASCYWIYLERSADARWYLHGLFA